MNDQSTFSLIIESFKEGREEAIRERKARQKDYKKRLIENFNYSPKEFYVLLAKALESRRVPGLTGGLVKLYESVRGSSKRLYMTVDRERFVYYVCAAPFGSGFFFSWRLVDERRPAEWYHFLILASLFAAISGFLSLLFLGPIAQLFGSFGYDPIAVALILPFVPVTFFLLQSVFLWSLMNYASIPGKDALARDIERTPVLGRVFERCFRPDTYFRHDSQEMFKNAFENALNETIESVTTPQGARKRDIADAPLVTNLHGK
jgi:hypothetical protein